MLLRSAFAGSPCSHHHLRTDNTRAMPFRLLLLLPFLFLLNTLSKAQTERLDLTGFQARMKEKGAQLVDVRTLEEFADGYIAGAVHNDWLEDGFLDRAKTLDKSKPVLLYCAAGGRSEDALVAMKAAGFTDVAHLPEGFNGWKRAKLPIATK